MYSKYTFAPGPAAWIADFICAVIKLLGASSSTGSFPLRIKVILNLFTLKYNSKSKFSMIEFTEVAAASSALLIGPPFLPLTIATGSGTLLTRYLNAPIGTFLPSSLAVTLIVASPCVVAFAMYLLPPNFESLTRVAPPPEMEGTTLGSATPGTEMDIGFSTPIYNTFILSADTTDDGLAAIYSDSNGYSLIWLVAGSFTLMIPPHFLIPSLPGRVEYLPNPPSTGIGAPPTVISGFDVEL